MVKNAAPKPACIAKRLADKKSGVIKKLKPCPWKGCPVANCNSCGQKTGDIDIHSTKTNPKYLYWLRSKYRIDKKRNWPSGHECHPCYYVRRKLSKDRENGSSPAAPKGESDGQPPESGGKPSDKYNPKMSQDELIKARKNATVDNQFWQLRQDYAAEKHEFKGCVELPKLAVEDSEKDFHKRFKSGIFTPIEEFAHDRFIQYAGRA